MVPEEAASPAPRAIAHVPENNRMPASNEPERCFPWWTIALLFLAVAYGIFRHIGFARLDEIKSTLRAKGYPVTLEELDAAYEKPAGGQNAAGVLALAFQQMQGITLKELGRVPYEGKAALAAECYRLEQGAFPESLGMLVPKYFSETPIDPFAGAP